MLMKRDLDFIYYELYALYILEILVLYRDLNIVLRLTFLCEHVR